MRSIWSYAGEQVDLDGAYLRLLHRTRSDRVELARLLPRLAHLQLSHSEYVERLAHLEAAGPRVGRRMGEKSLPQDQVQRRRLREHERRIRYLRKEITERRNEIASIAARRLELEAEIQGTLREAVAEGKRIAGRADLRMASYIKGACRSHPDPNSLTNAAVRLGTGKREWLNLTSADELLERTQEEDR